jgi:DNA-directed RNA polymerase subunit E'/Rpb7
MEHKVVFEEQVGINPKDMRGKIDSIETLVQDKLQARLEGRCSKHGYVVPGTLKLISRAMGILEKGRFTGSFIFHVQAEGNVLNPPEGIVIEGEVIRKNKMGMYVSYKDAIRVIIPRDLHIGDEAFESVEIGETVQVEIKKSRFQVNDPYILSVGMFRSSKGKKAEPARARTPVAPVAENDFGEEDEEEEEDEDLNELAKALDAEDKESGDEEVE